MSQVQQQDESNKDSNSEDVSILKIILPYLISTGLITLAICIAFVHFFGNKISNSHNVQYVTFDIIKFVNSQKSVASEIFSRNGDTISASILLKDLPKKVSVSINKIAGNNTIVIIKQAVVGSSLPDITDDVLKDLGLPTKVATNPGLNFPIDMSITTVPTPSKPVESNPESDDKKKTELP